MILSHLHTSVNYKKVNSKRKQLEKKAQEQESSN